MSGGRWLVALVCAGVVAGCGPSGAPADDGPGTPPPVETGTGGGGSAQTPPPPGPAACGPTTCRALGLECGRAPDGCGGVQECGSCAASETCGGGGQANVCGTAPCRARSCAEAGAACGVVSDGCGGTLSCGSCGAGEACHAGACEPLPCQPATCAELGATCGSVPDGCGGRLACGTCGEGQLCGTGGTPNTCAAPAPINCADVDLGTRLPVRVDGYVPWSVSTPASRLQATTCGDSPRGHDAAEHIYAWHAPADGTYVIDTAGSAFDTVLSVRRGSCSGEEIACNDDGISQGGQSRVVLTLEAGEGVVIVVDAVGTGSGGPYRLHIHRKATSEERCGDGADDDGDGRVDCADTDCNATAACRDGSACTDGRITEVPAGGAAMAVPMHITGQGNDFVPSCGMARTGDDQAFLFTAPRGGTFAFSLQSTVFNAALFVLDRCGGGEISCQTAWALPNYTAYAQVSLAKGASVLVVADQTWPWSPDLPSTLYVNEWVRTEVRLCHDSADNDADGRADGEDADCIPLAPSP